MPVDTAPSKVDVIIVWGCRSEDVGAVPHVSHKVLTVLSQPQAKLQRRPTRSPYWNRLSEYIGAEMAGKKEGDCRKFEKDCTKSLYKLNKYS